MLQIVSNSSQLTQNTKMHVIPASLKINRYDNANVSNYFYSTFVQTKDSQHPIAFLHGQELHGTKVTPKDVFLALVTKNEADIDNSSSPQQQTAKIVLLQKINEITDWRAQSPWEDYKGPLGIVDKYTLLQQALHSQL